MFLMLSVLFCPFSFSLQVHWMVFEQLRELGKLYETGILTQEEFEEKKKSLLQELPKI